MKTNRTCTRLWFASLVIVAVGLVGCQAASAPPKEWLPRAKSWMTAPAPPVRAPSGVAFGFAGNVRNVFFEFDKSRLTSDARDTLEDNATWLRDHSDIKVRIEGHADERGSVEYNLALGERRAMRVRSYLISLGIDSARIFTISFGEERPAARGHNERAWAKNRRGEFKVAQ